MGGPGSGSWYRWQCKPRVEAYRRLDIRQWHRQRMLQPGRIFAWAWYTHEGAVAASMLVHIKPETVILTYRYRRRDETWQAITESVALTWTPCHYGGQRAWFRCPGHTPSCTAPAPISSVAPAMISAMRASGKIPRRGGSRRPRRSVNAWGGVRVSCTRFRRSRRRCDGPPIGSVRPRPRKRRCYRLAWHWRTTIDYGNGTAQFANTGEAS
jgi:hypothetical protein